MTFRLGTVDCDTSHAGAFTQRLHHIDIGEDHWVDGAQVVAAVPMPSLVSPERVPRFVEQLHGYGIQILEQPEQLIGMVDAVLVEANDGSVHRELLKRIVHMLQTGKRPRPDGALIEPVAFQEASLRSMERAGAPVALTEAGFPA